MAIEGQAAETQTQTADSGQPAAKPEGQPQAPNAQATSGTPDPASNTGKSRPDQGVLRDLQSERTKRQQFERQFTESQAQIADLNRRIQALAGVTPKSAEEQDVEVIRAQFAKLYPHLAGLSPEAIEQMNEAAKAQQSLQQTANHIWMMHGQQMVNSVSEIVSGKLGGELSERQARALTLAYIKRAETDPEFLARHEQGDPKLVQEFAQEWLEDWFEPARRSVTTQAVNRSRPVPSGRGSATVTTGKPKIDYKNEKAVEDAAVAAFLEHGGSFGRD